MSNTLVVLQSNSYTPFVANNALQLCFVVSCSKAGN